MAAGKNSPKVVGEGITGAAAIAATILLSPLTGRWYRKWGATKEEVRRSLPGDDLVPQARSEITLAITIQAPARQIWPWLVQIGCQRAGWYSYDLLDNGGIPSTGRIISEYQQLEIGDEIPFTPDGNMGFPVVAIEPGRALVMGGTTNTSSGDEADPNDPDLQTYLSGAIILFLYELDPGTTRLIYRMPLGWNPNWRNTLIYRGFLEPISFVMARKTLLGVKQRVEAVHAGAIAQSPI
jgi:proline iminopeptidase